jgi:hypothetical protein
MRPKFSYAALSVSRMEAVNAHPRPYYYLENFKVALEWLRSRYSDLLSAQEQSFVAQFERLPGARCIGPVISYVTPPQRQLAFMMASAPGHLAPVHRCLQYHSKAAPVCTGTADLHRAVSTGPRRRARPPSGSRPGAVSIGHPKISTNRSDPFFNVRSRETSKDRTGSACAGEATGLHRPQAVSPAPLENVGEAVGRRYRSSTAITWRGVDESGDRVVPGYRAGNDRCA